jgi:F0F1-type ATP synthase assembly protein I
MEQTILVIGLLVALAAGMIWAPRATIGLIGKLIGGAISLLADTVALIFTWV